MKPAHLWTALIAAGLAIASLGTSRPRQPPHLAPPAKCPASFAAALDEPGCIAGQAACQYPEGSCTCVGGAICGGVGTIVPPVLRCVSQVLKREDGCLYAPPRTGERCSEEGKVCLYTVDRCGSEALRATCTNTTWSVLHEDLPRPP